MRGEVLELMAERYLGDGVGEVGGYPRERLIHRGRVRLSHRRCQVGREYVFKIRRAPHARRAPRRGWLEPVRTLPVLQLPSRRVRSSIGLRDLSPSDRRSCAGTLLDPSDAVTSDLCICETRAGVFGTRSGVPAVHSDVIFVSP